MPSTIEIIGYIASILVAVSLMMSSLLKLRIINLIGAVVFTIYGLIIHAYPVAAVNFFIVLIDLYYLVQMLSAREYFRLLEMPPDSSYLAAFLAYYQDEIHRFLPSFNYHPEDSQLTLFILRDMVPAGLFIADQPGPGCLHVQLDFAIPGYRDFKIARFLFVNQAGFFKERGIHHICTDPGTETHARYLQQMGFASTASGCKLSRLCLEIP